MMAIKTKQSVTPVISVIIPTYQEEHTIASTIIDLVKKASGTAFEIIIIDASKDDKTLSAIAHTKLKTGLKKRLKTIQSKKGRSYQMNTGAKYSKGIILLFLHSDTKLPKNWDKLIAKPLDFDYGCFYKKFDNQGLFYKANAMYTNIRCNLTGYMMGDHAIFVKHKAFNSVLGYSKLSIMEDVDLSLKLRGMRKKIIKKSVTTSARRFEKYGKLKMWYVMQKMKLYFFLGATDEKLRSLYH